jgi:hypothetical protein
MAIYQNKPNNTALLDAMQKVPDPLPAPNHAVAEPDTTGLARQQVVPASGQGSQAAQAMSQWADGVQQASGNSRYYQSAPRTSAANDFTGRIDIPQSDSKYEQQFTTMGIPMTDKSWAMQDHIDGGKLHVVNDLHFLAQVPQELRKNIDMGKYSALSDPKSQLSEAERAALRADLSAQVRHLNDVPEVQHSFGNMNKQQFTNYQSSILKDYIGQAAKSGKDASFILDVMPTEMAKKDPFDISPTHYAVGDYILNTRYSSAALADSQRQQHKEVFGLAVPYSNTAENIIYNGGIPRDGVANLSHYVSQIKGANHDINTIASGYSQGSTAVLQYAREKGKSQGLDAAIALAPMGGVDGHGNTGLSYGQLGGNRHQQGVPTLAISNAEDPARRIHPAGLCPGSWPVPGGRTAPMPSCEPRTRAAAGTIRGWHQS